MSKAIDSILKPVALEQPGPCSTCRHFRPDGFSAILGGCAATSTYAAYARRGECGGGRLWEAKPAPVPVLVRFKRWLVG